MIAELAEIDRPVPEAPSPVGSGAVPQHVAKDLLHGTSALGVGLVFERGFGFLANLLAARFGGASTFGAYSLALSTANNISSYAAGGIGSTSVRFSGRYSRTSAGYPTLVRVLTIIALLSGALAALALWAGAAPIGHLLAKPSLTGLLRWAALSAAGMILLECCRGFLVGQRRIPAILFLSLTIGIGMIALLPLASRIGPIEMICSQSVVALGAVALCVLFYRPLGLAAMTSDESPEPLGSMLREVWSFGLVQLAGLIGMNAAGWWLTTLVARSDTSLIQMGFLAISHQLRNLVALLPSMLTESSLAVMARGEDETQNTPDHVMALCTLATTLASLAVAGVGIIIVPWGLTLLYGRTYSGASTAAALALATAVIHMGSSPASARLSIVSIKTTGVINTVWALLVAVGATSFFWIGGNAWKGASIYLVAHLVSAVLVLRYLSKRGHLVSGAKSAFYLGTGASIGLALLAFYRSEHQASSLAISVAMVFLLSASLWGLSALGRRHGWFPSARLVFTVLKMRGRLRPAPVETPTSGGFDA